MIPQVFLGPAWSQARVWKLPTQPCLHGPGCSRWLRSCGQFNIQQCLPNSLFFSRLCGSEVTPMFHVFLFNGTAALLPFT